MCEIVVVVNRKNEKRKPHRTATITAEELEIKKVWLLQILKIRGRR
ncbi:hypothetical protein C5S32_07555 [ANME-1 cluster archaeon GoMg1]|nr:hypothetical protein [ANME-1 cluster archaeon GoMg1]